MKTIIRIARLELASLFYSPVAWLILILFMVQDGMAFGYFLEQFAGDQEAGWSMKNLTLSIFVANSGGDSVIIILKQSLFLYIPLLTMGLISRERSSGSIRLLQSSPISSLEIVLGKFAAMMGLGFLLVALLGLFVTAGAFSIQSMDAPLLLSGMIGLYLLLLTYSAIGLYLSSLTSYPAIAAISTLAVLGALNYMGQVGQGIHWVRNITYYLRLPERVVEFSIGLISSANVFYFLTVTFFFLGLTILQLEWGRMPGFRPRKLMHFLVLAGGCTMMGYISSMPRLTAYTDMTADKKRTLTKTTQEILKKIEGPLRIHTYVNILDDYRDLALPNRKNADGAFWEPYRRFRPDLQIDYTYYYDSTKTADKSFPGLSQKERAEKYVSIFDLNSEQVLSPAEIRRKSDLRSEEGRFVRQVEAGGKTTQLRIFDDFGTQPDEAEIAAALKRLTIPAPKIAFLTGNYERRTDRVGDRSYRPMATRPNERHSLINQGFDVIDITADSPGMPAGVSALVIADPVTPFMPEQLQKIGNYIADGGNLLIAGEPGRQVILNPLLEKLGVRLTDDSLLSADNAYAPDLLLAKFDRDTAKYAPLFRRLQAPGARVSMPGSAGLQYDSAGIFNIVPVLVTDKKESTPVLLALTRSVNRHQQRILVAGDADFLSQAEWNRKAPANTVNGRLALDMFSWLTGGAFPVDVSRTDSPDTSILVTYKQAARISIIFLFLLPGLLLAAGTVLLIGRKRR